MRGTIRRIPILPESGKFRLYCFIEVGRESYFLHSTEFQGHWFNDLCDPIKRNETVDVEFTPIDYEHEGVMKKRATAAKVIDVEN